MKRRLGVPMTEAIRKLYEGRLPGFTDLVCYWFENARVMIEEGVVVRAGLVATNSIRKNTNLPVMKRIANTTRIYCAWPEEQWIGLSKSDASLFASPFHHIATTPDDDGLTVKELRKALAERAGPRWWEPHWPRPEMRSRI